LISEATSAIYSAAMQMPQSAKRLPNCSVWSRSGQKRLRVVKRTIGLRGIALGALALVGAQFNDERLRGTLAVRWQPPR